MCPRTSAGQAVKNKPKAIIAAYTRTTTNRRHSQPNISFMLTPPYVQILFIIFDIAYLQNIVNMVYYRQLKPPLRGDNIMKKLTRNLFRKEVVSCATLAEINYDRSVRMCDFKVSSATWETLLWYPGRLAYCHIFARCHGNQTDVFVNNKYLTTFFRR